MRRLLFRRTLRALAANWLRYGALLLLVVCSMLMIVGVVGSALCVVHTVDRHARQNLLEDGQFGTFVPLEPSDLRHLEADGILIEPDFYLDYARADGSVLRVMQNRSRINLPDIADGRPAAAPDEVMLERIYSEAHGIVPGDTVELAGRSLTVTGICTTPDYDHCLRMLSDMYADGRQFGTAFVTQATYDDLAATGAALRAPDYRYSYRLTGTGTERGLKEKLFGMDVPVDRVQDVFFRSMVRQETRDRSRMTRSMAELAEGSAELQAAMHALSDGTSELAAGVSDVREGVGILNAASDGLTGGSASVLAALSALEKGAEDLTVSTESLKMLQSASADILNGLASLETGLQVLSEQISPAAFDAVMQQAFRQAGQDPAVLSPDAGLLLGVIQAWLTEAETGIGGARDGASTLRAGYAEIDRAIGAWPAAIEVLNSGISEFRSALNTLKNEYTGLDSGIRDYTGGVGQVADGLDRIQAAADTLSDGAQQLAESGSAFQNGVDTMNRKTREALDVLFPLQIQNLTDFVPASDNPRIKASRDDVLINVNVGMLSGVIVLVLITYVISIFVVHDIDRERPVIGALYALGVRPGQLLGHYTMVPVVVAFVGGLIGTLLGYAPFWIQFMVGESFTYYSTPAMERVIAPELLIYGILMPPVIAFAVNGLSIRKRLRQSALSLLRKEEPRLKHSGIRIRTGGFISGSFIRVFQVRQFLREKRSTLAVLGGLFISLLVLILGLNCYVLCKSIQDNNIADTRYTYFYQYKYPTEQPPAGGTPAYVESLKREALGYDLPVTVIGLTDANPYFPPIASNCRNAVSISRSMASKFGLKPGDELILHNRVEDVSYGFTVKEIVPYSVGLCCFMDIDSMRSLFGQDTDYYNAVYADHELDIPGGRLYNTTLRRDIVASSNIFLNMLMPMVTVMTLSAVLILVVVLYQMIQVMVDRSAGSILMLKVFGYRSREIRRLFLDGNLITVAGGSLLLIPAAKWLMDAVYPIFVVNVACGIDLNWPPLLYAVVYAGILLCYVAIRAAISVKMNRMTPAGFLRSRE